MPFVSKDKSLVPRTHTQKETQPLQTHAGSIYSMQIKANIILKKREQVSFGALR